MPSGARPAWSVALAVTIVLAAMMFCAGRGVAADAKPAGGAAMMVVDPPQLKLVGPDARWQLLVDRREVDGRMVDGSEGVRFTSTNDKTCTVSDTGEVVAVGNGSSTITVEGPLGVVRVPVTVSEIDAHRAINFENDIVPLLTRYACNSSGCHGKAEGQNGFKLSVFGFDAQADYDALTKETRGRRVFPASAEHSLLLQKATGTVPHGGGARMVVGGREYELIRAWIAAGVPFGSDSDPRVASIQLTPRERRLPMQARQRLRVTARYTDGREVDVTALTKFQSNNDLVAGVDESGLVTVGQRPGQVAIMANFAGQVDVFTALVPREGTTDEYKPIGNEQLIDRLVIDRLQSLNIAPSGGCDDATFFRRATLDIIGKLPTADEARAFLADKRSDKRARWIDSLLDRPEFVDFWALKWADLLRVDRQSLGHKLAHDYYQWIRASLAENKPLDRMTFELLTAEGPLAEAPQGAFFKAVPKPGEAASTVAQVFLGVRIACAECHHHPHDRWSQTDYYGMTAFFTQVNRKASTRGEAIVALGDPKTTHPRTKEEVVAHALGEIEPEELPKGDRRPQLASWLVSAKNPWFAKNMANRIWAHFLGRGIVEPVDDVRATNPPSNPKLLDALAADLVKNHFDFKSLVRTIANSATYQRSATPNATNADDEQNYSRALFKPMAAEVLLDAVCDATGVPEKFDGQAAGSRAVQLWDSKVSHYFLRLFGRPQRTTACTCERTIEPNVSQVLHLLNSPDLHAKLDHRGGFIWRLAAESADQAKVEPAKITEELYLTFLARYPSDDERRLAVEYLGRAGVDRRQAIEDLAWSLMNTLEFVFNH